MTPLFKPPSFKPPSSKPRFTFRQLLWHCMMGMTLGILCAGLLLYTRIPELLPLDQPGAMVSRFGYLLAVGIPFGICATLTGALFTVSDQS